MRLSPLHRWISLAVAAAVVPAAGCNVGNPAACTVTCGDQDVCPDGTSCGTDKYCHAPDEVPATCSPGTDGDGAPFDGPDGSVTGDPDAAMQPDADVVDPPDACSSTFAGVNPQQIAIPEFDPIGVTSVIQADAPCVVLDTAEVRVDITHPYRGDISIDLTTPAGDTVRLLDPDFADTFDDIHAIFPLDVTGGGEASGAWQLTVADNFREDVGTLDRWSIGINTTAP